MKKKLREMTNADIETAIKDNINAMKLYAILTIIGISVLGGYYILAPDVFVSDPLIVIVGLALLCICAINAAAIRLTEMRLEKRIREKFAEVVDA